MHKDKIRNKGKHLNTFIFSYNYEFVWLKTQNRIIIVLEDIELLGHVVLSCCEDYVTGTSLILALNLVVRTAAVLYLSIYEVVLL